MTPKPEHHPDISVIIPTLQRSEKLMPLVRMYSSHPRVAEIIIINNTADPFPGASLPKVRVEQQASNIYVNPAWNLGADLASCPILLISNDDILVSPKTVSAMASALKWPVGLIGLDASCRHNMKDNRPWFIPAFRLTPAYGTLMALRRRDYKPIPEDLLIWYGDDWLFGQQTSMNLALRGIQLDTKMSETVRTPGMEKVWGADVQKFTKYSAELPYARRFRLMRAGWDVLRRGWSGPNGLKNAYRKTLRRLTIQ